MSRATEEGLELATDVLVVGGGLAATWAAAAAARAGAAVVLADKGWCGTSGVTAQAGPGHWWVPPEGRREAIDRQLERARGLGDPDWMERVIETTWASLPTLAAYYAFPTGPDGRVAYRGLRGPEYLRAMRRLILDLGVTVLDHSPALELLATADGAVAGARGVRRQEERAWTARAGAVVLATGGCAFGSHLLGAANNTGDGLLMGVEAGATLSGMEFDAFFTPAPARSNMTRTVSYAFATYTDVGGAVIDVPPLEAARTLARALLRGPVYARFDRMPPEIRERLHLVQPAVMLPFERVGIDPFTDRFEITLRGEGTVRGVGGLALADTDAGTGVEGLYAAGDVASREPVAGAVSGGGAQNSAWALTTGQLAGRAAAEHAGRGGARTGRLTGLGRAASGRGGAGALPFGGMHEIATAVREEVLDLDKALFRTAPKLARSAARLDALWPLVRDARAASDRRGRVRAREAAAQLAVARFSLAAALARPESRGLHVREDAAAEAPGWARRIVVRGLDAPQTHAEPPLRQELAA